MTEITKSDNLDEVVDDLSKYSSWDIGVCSFGFDNDDLEIMEDQGNYTQYHYRLPKDIKVKINDFVVVKGAGGLTIAVITDILPNNFSNAGKANKATAWILSKIDISAHQLRVKTEEKRQFIKDKLEERRQQFEDLQIYKIMAKEDEEVAKLLDTLKDIK